MITRAGYSKVHEYTEVLNYLKELQPKSVVDVGGTASRWSAAYTTTIVDCLDPKAWANSGLPIPAEQRDCPARPDDIQWFGGDICEHDTWLPVLEYVEANGKFDFAICTHTLEDLFNPKLVCSYFGQIAKEGFIAIPSKFSELSRNGELFRGWDHHRWIYNYNDGFVAYAKLPFIEYADWADEIAQKCHQHNEQFWLWWEDDIELKSDFIPSDGYLDGVTLDQHYRMLLEN